MRIRHLLTGVVLGGVGGAIAVVGPQLAIEHGNPEGTGPLYEVGQQVRAGDEVLLQGVVRGGGPAFAKGMVFGTEERWTTGTPGQSNPKWQTVASFRPDLTIDVGGKQVTLACEGGLTGDVLQIEEEVDGVPHRWRGLVPGMAIRGRATLHRGGSLRIPAGGELRVAALQPAGQEAANRGTTVIWLIYGLGAFIGLAGLMAFFSAFKD